MNVLNWRHSWYAFLELLSFNLRESFSCDVCGQYPDTIICDATSLGFQRKFAVSSLECNEGEVIPKYS